MDSKRCDRVFHKKSLYPPVIPLVQRNMICATSYGENLCYVSVWGLPASLFLGVSPGLGSCSLGLGLLLPQPGTVLAILSL